MQTVPHLCRSQDTCEPFPFADPSIFLSPLSFSFSEGLGLEIQIVTRKGLFIEVKTIDHQGNEFVPILITPNTDYRTTQNVALSLAFQT